MDPNKEQFIDFKETLNRELDVQICNLYTSGAVQGDVDILMDCIQKMLHDVEISLDDDNPIKGEIRDYIRTASIVGSDLKNLLDYIILHNDSHRIKKLISDIALLAKNWKNLFVKDLFKDKATDELREELRHFLETVETFANDIGMLWKLRDTFDGQISTLKMLINKAGEVLAVKPAELDLSGHIFKRISDT